MGKSEMFIGKRAFLILFIIATLLFLSGCTPTSFGRASLRAEIGPIPDIKRRVPLKAALLISSSTKAFSYKAQIPMGWWEYPFGERIEGLSFEAFSQIFEEIRVIRAKQNLDRFDIVIEPEFDKKKTQVKIGLTRMDVTVSVAYYVSDRDGVFWRNVFVGDITTGGTAGDMKRHGEALSEAVEQAALQMWRDFNTKEFIDRVYAKRTKPQVAVKTDMTAATKKEPQPEVYEKPKIIIINPPIQRGISVIRQASVTIRGRVEDAYGVDWVTINGQDAALRSGGLFELTVNLAERNNNFTIKTMNKKGITAEKMIALTRKVATLERPAVKPSLPNIFALLIGINNYHDERISDLNFAEQDAQALYRFLIDPQRGAVLPKRVKLLVGDLATASVIEQNLKRTLRASSPGDMIIIYMATHGVPDPEGGTELFFLSSDSNMDSLLKTSISKADLEKMLSRYVSNRKIILITDACHAGGIGMSSQLMAFSTRSIQQRTFRLLNKLATSHDGLGILSASRANELSQEDSKWGGGHGVFTYYLIRGLGGEADKSPSDGFVTLRELRDYLYDKVSASTSNLQTPELVGNYDPNVPIAIVR